MKIVFLDRDGVINEFPGDGKYVTKLKEMHLLPRSAVAMRILNEAGYEIFVISNQAGVGKGIYSFYKLDLITRTLMRELSFYGVKVRGFFYCTHHSNAGCDCRKPEIGNIRNALKSVGKTIRSAGGSFFVGDTKSDILTGFNAKCKTILVLSGRAKRNEVRHWGVKPDFIAKDLLEAVQIIIEDRSPPVDRSKQHEIYLKRNHIQIRTSVHRI